MLDPEDLLDPAEEQLDRPATFVEIGNLAGWRIEIVGDDAQNLPVSSLTLISRTAFDIGLCRLAAIRSGRKPIRSERILSGSAGNGRSSISSNGVLDFSRVTRRHAASSSFAHQP